MKSSLGLEVYLLKLGRKSKVSSQFFHIQFDDDFRGFLIFFLIFASAFEDFHTNSTKSHSEGLFRLGVTHFYLGLQSIEEESLKEEALKNLLFDSRPL